MYGIDAKRAVCVSGITSTDTDDDVIAAIDTYGVVKRVVRVHNTEGEVDNVIVEFESEATRATLEPDIPFELQSVSDSTVKWQVTRVEELTKPGTSSQNPDVEKTSSQNPDADKTSPTSSDSSESDSESDPSSDDTTPLIKRTSKKYDIVKPLPNPLAEQSKKGKTPVSVQKTAVSVQKTPVSGKKTPVSVKKKQSSVKMALTDDLTNPPEVQRIVVEHVIKNEASSPHNQSRWLRSFSGKVPKPPGEADYDTWCLHVDLMFQDFSSVDVRRRKILESLLPPASDIIKPLGPYALPQEYVKLLDSAYGLVEDGEEIFAKFLNTNQDLPEKPSDYLQRLHVLLSTAVKRGGVKQADANRHLVKQFKRGCWDSQLLLQLDLKTDKPPNFAELLLQLRTEEDRKATKMDRMHRHLGTTKSKANVSSMSDVSTYGIPDAGVLQAYISETESLRKQVADLQMQLESKKSRRERKSQNKAAEPTANKDPPVPRAEAQAHQVPSQAVPKQPRAWFCFRCGENGHIAKVCENPINKAAVEQKQKELQAKQEEWKAKHGLPLN